MNHVHNWKHISGRSIVHCPCETSDRRETPCVISIDGSEPTRKPVWVPRLMATVLDAGKHWERRTKWREREREREKKKEKYRDACMGLDRRNADRTALNSPIAALENGLRDRVRDLEVKKLRDC